MDGLARVIAMFQSFPVELATQEAAWQDVFVTAEPGQQAAVEAMAVELARQAYRCADDPIQVISAGPSTQAMTASTISQIEPMPNQTPSDGLCFDDARELAAQQLAEHAQDAQRWLVVIMGAYWLGTSPKAARSQATVRLRRTS